MDIGEKIVDAFMKEFAAGKVELDYGGGVSGIVVADAFRGHESLERQDMIYAALRKHGLTEDEIRQVLMISALTPEEASGYFVH